MRPDRVHVKEDLFTFPIDVWMTDPAFGYRAMPDIDGKSVRSPDQWRR